MRSQLILVAILGIASSLHAQTTEPPPPAEDAETLIQQGVELRRDGRDEEAAGYFERAYALSPSPRAAAQLGLVSQALGIWDRAYKLLTEALAATEDPWVRDNRGPLESALHTTRSNVATLELRGGISGATVLIDGAEVGTLPIDEPLVLRAGAHNLEIRAEGHFPFSRELTLGPGQAGRESVTLRPRPQPTSSSTSAESDTGAGPGAAGSPAAPPPPPRPSGAQTAGPVLLGLGLALAASSTAAFVIGENAAQDWNDDDMCLVGTMTREETCGDLESRANASRVAGYVVAGLGGALAITGLVLWLTGGSSERRDAATVRCAPGLTSLSCEAQF